MTDLRAFFGTAAVGALIGAAAIAAPQGAAAVVTLDQEHTQITGAAFTGHFSTTDDGGVEVIPHDIYRAQTFTAARSGPLTKVEIVPTNPGANATHDLSVELRTVQAGGAPGDTVLASATVPIAAVSTDANSYTFVPVAFAAPASVVAGTRYALVFHAADPDVFDLRGSGTDSYAGGANWDADGAPTGWSVTAGVQDLAFRTYVDVPTAPTTPVFDPACDSDGVRAGYNVIKGTEGNDVLKGTMGRDLIYGFGGDDVIKGRGGDDLICGGPGNDTIIGGKGRDFLIGGDGHDRLVGNGGNDRLRGGAGDDTLLGNGGRDAMRGGFGDDVLRGGAGDDQLYGGPGRDVLRGGQGNDLIDSGPGKDDVAPERVIIGS